MRLAKGQLLSIEVDASNPTGDAGIALVDDCRIETPGLFVGEAARIEIVHIGKSKRRAWGRLHTLEKAHPGRRQAPCQHQDTCGGCPWMVLEDAERRRTLKQRSEELLGLQLRELFSVPERALGYRQSSKRVAFQHEGQLRLGSYQRGSHAFATMSQCLVDHPRIAAAAREVEERASELNIEAWYLDDDGQSHGDLRYVWFKTDGKDVLVTLVTGSQTSRAPELAAALTAAGVAWCVHGSNNNVMRATEVQSLQGSTALKVELCETAVDLGPLGFLQPNPEVASQAYRELVAGHQGDLAFDLYAGAGVTTAMLRQSFKEVRACESNPESAKALAIEAERVETFLARQPDVPELIVANPPRAGLGEAVCDLLNDRGCQHLHIMSCNPKSMRRDLDRLLDEGIFELSDALGFDTLPQTPHVELVIKLKRRS